MGRIVFVNRFFWPDHSATSQILSDLAFHLAGMGREVHVVTSRLRYDRQGDPLPPHEVVRGVTVHRVRTSSFGRVGLAGRAADYASFYVAAHHALAQLAGTGDIVVAKTDPPLLSILAARVARWAGARLVNWSQDLYPEVAQQLGVRWLGGPIGALLVAARDRSLRAADVNVAIGELMAARFAAHGVPASRITVIPNWVPGPALRPVAHADNGLRREWGLEGRFVVGYSGNLGRAHEYRTLLGAARRLKEHRDLCFLFIGGGHHVRSLAAEAEAGGLAHLFAFRPYQDSGSLALSLSVPDVHWVSLRPELEGLIVPSKFYGIAAVGRPVLAVSDPDGEIGRLVARHGCGLCVPPGDEAGLAAAILQLKVSPETCSRMGRYASGMLELHYARSQALERWVGLFDGLGCRPASSHAAGWSHVTGHPQQ